MHIQHWYRNDKLGSTHNLTMVVRMYTAGITSTLTLYGPRLSLVMLQQETKCFLKHRASLVNRGSDAIPIASSYSQ